MNVNYLKSLFKKKYGDCLFLAKPIEVLVTLTPEQYNELNEDIMSSAKSLFLLVDESDYVQPEPGSVLFTRINIPDFCEFIIEVGTQFEFGLLDKNQEHGDETL